MYTATKDNRKVGLHNDVQAAAYKKSGWEVTNTPTNPTAGDGKPADLDALKAEATALGVDFGPNIGYVKLLERIEAAKANAEPPATPTAE